MAISYPFSLKQYNVYPNAGGALIGVADVVMPKLMFVKDTISGAGIAGSLSVPVMGNVQPMQCTINWHVNSVPAFALFQGNGQQVRIMSDVYNFNNASGLFSDVAEEVVMTLFSSEHDLGKREASVKAIVSQVYDVTFLLVVFQGKTMWQIDPMSDVCVLNGVDVNVGARANT
jgi:hypothetical protein